MTNSYPDELDQSQTKRRIQYDFKVKVGLVPRFKLELINCRHSKIWIVKVQPSIDVLNGYDESGVAQHPKSDKSCTEDLVFIIYCPFGTRSCISWTLRQCTLDSIVERGINILLDLGGIFNNGCIHIRSLLRVDGW